MSDKLPWDRAMDPRNALHPDNPRYQTRITRSGRPVNRSGYPVHPSRYLRASVDMEWLEAVCEKAHVEVPSSCRPSQWHCPVTLEGHVLPGLRPGTSNSDINVIFEAENQDVCVRCGYRVEGHK